MKRYGLLLCLLLPVATVAQTDSVAPAACARCHVEALTQPATYMAHALETVDKCKVLIEHPVLTTTVGKYTYRIERKGSESEYSVTDGIDGDDAHRVGDGSQFCNGPDLHSGERWRAV